MYFRTYINSPEAIKNFKNPLYESNKSIIWPSLYIQNFSLWSSLFLRYQRKENPIKEAKNEIVKKVEANLQAHEKVEKLKK